jgi:hypothetical protein
MVVAGVMVLCHRVSIGDTRAKSVCPSHKQVGSLIAGTGFSESCVEDSRTPMAPNQQFFQPFLCLAPLVVNLSNCGFSQTAVLESNSDSGRLQAWPA